MTSASSSTFAPPVPPRDLPEPRLGRNALAVLENRYLRKDARTGEIVETPRELFWRVACAVAVPEFEVSPENGERWARRFYDLMAGGAFMPNSPTLMNAGREMGMLSACFVLPVEDSIQGIFTTLQHVALIQKAGGGTGFDFSRLRPEGDLVASSGGRTSGPLAFIDAFSAGTEAIQQGAFRRGANMGVMRCDHPDVVEFVCAKQDPTRWTNYNVSVSVTNEWMTKVTEHRDEPLEVVNPRNGERGLLAHVSGRRRSEPVYGADPAAPPEGGWWTYGELFDLIVESAWRTGEPGLLFLDRANEDNMLPQLGPLEATNPCGEQWLLPYGSCNLGSLNLRAFLDDDADRSAPWRERMDWDAFDEAVTDAVRFLDDVVSVNRYPIPEIAERAALERRIGLGVMGFADLLLELGIRYGSDESTEVARELGRRLLDTAVRASERLVSEDGREPFGAWEGSMPERGGYPPRRNSHLTTVAPTGTISIIAGCSGGIEPLFSLAFERRVMKDADGNPVVMREVAPAFERALVEAGYDEDERARFVEHVLRHGTLAGSDVEPEIAEVFVTAHDVAPEEHVLMQAAWQAYVDNAVSKTVNLPHDAAVEDVRKVWLLAWREGCKGVTVYRDGCRSEQPMALKQEEGAAAPAAATELRPRPLPELLPCLRIRQLTPFGNMHVKVSVDPREQRELEVFAQLGKGGDVASSDLEGICRLLSLFLRSGGSLELALEQLEGIGSSLSVPSADGRIMSLPDGLAKALRRYLAAKEKHGLEALLLGRASAEDVHAKENGRAEVVASTYKVKCPACGGVLSFAEGCCVCHGCGFSQC